MKLDEIKESVTKCENLANYVPDNKFSKYDFVIRPDLVGRQIDQRVYEISEQIDEILRLLPKYKYLVALADKRYKEALGKATFIIESSNEKMAAKIKNEKILFHPITLSGDKKETTVYAESMNKAMLDYIVETGEGKLDLGKRMIDYGRSILSYSKVEINKNV